MTAFATEHSRSRLRRLVEGPAGVWLVGGVIVGVMLAAWLASGWQPRYSRQVVLGLSSGSLYALLALALVLVYRSTGFVNFAQGEQATLSTYLAWSLTQSVAGSAAHPWLLLAAALAVGFVMGAGIDVGLIRRIDTRSPLNAAVLAVALFLVISSVTMWIYGATPHPVPSIFGTGSISLGTIQVSRHALGAAGAALALMGGISALFRYTRVGLALRAVAADPLAAQLVGIRVRWILTLGWGLAGAAGALAGLLIAHSFNLSPTMMLEVLLFALTAAVIGGLTSPGGAVLGGLAVGVAQNVLGVTAILGGSQLRLFWAFALILVVLVVRPNGLFGRASARRL